jgi:SAM-dependent methyltransferase
MQPEAAATSERGVEARFTYQGNGRDTRYGWLRLTPAYSVHLVRELLDARVRPELPVLDPFCGTGTTLLTCAERGIACTTLDVNPFLIWLARAKSANYGKKTRIQAALLVAEMASAAGGRGQRAWLPALFQIEKWWSPPRLHALARANAALCAADASKPARDLAKLAFCRALISTANVSFGHQSMSFKNACKSSNRATLTVAEALEQAFLPISLAAERSLPRSERRAVLGDARELTDFTGPARFGTVITSPPYVNRMSYVRELRPYMYWLGYLERASDAGELDWQAIGGTWGAATSRVAVWETTARLPLTKLPALVTAIARQSDVLARYVLKYFFDMLAHVRSMARLLARGGEVHYVVGNSKFFDVLVPVELFFAELFELSGFRKATVRQLRKRSSKPELYEYLVSAIKR